MPRNRQSLLSMVVLATPLLAYGCGGQGKSGSTTGVNGDRSGDPINSAPVDGDRPRYIVDSTPLVTIPGTGRFSGPVLLSGHRLLVMNHETRQLILCDSTGAVLTTMGGSGAGPGELVNVTALGGGPGDSIVVYDAAQRRVSVFGPNGKFGRSLSWTGGEDRLPYLFPTDVVVGRFLSKNTRATRSPVQPTLTREPFQLAIMSLDGTIEDTVGTFEDSEFLVSELAVSRVRFDRGTIYAAAESTIYVGDNEDYLISEYSRSGRLIRQIRREFTKVVPTAADIQAAKERLLRGTPDGLLATFLEAETHRPTAPFKPAYDHLVVAATGELWVRQYNWPYTDDQPSKFDVFDQRGRWLATVAVPAGFTPTVIESDRMWGRAVDGEGVERVESRNIRGTEGLRNRRTGGGRGTEGGQRDK